MKYPIPVALQKHEGSRRGAGAHLNGSVRNEGTLGGEANMSHLCVGVSQRGNGPIYQEFAAFRRGRG